MQHFVSADKQAEFTPNIKLCIAVIFSIGVIACAGLILAALIATAYLLKLSCTVLIETAASIAHLYSTSDNAVQLLMLVIAGYLVARACKFAYRSLKK